LKIDLLAQEVFFFMIINITIFIEQVREIIARKVDKFIVILAENKIKCSGQCDHAKLQYNG
jgi:hypothetical protein